MDVDTKLKRYRDPYKVLTIHEHFTLFMVSTNGLLGKEAKTFLKKLSSLLVEKWGKSHSEVCT
jgi:hypothetical protein